MPRASLGNFGHRAINHYTGNSSNPGNQNNREAYNAIAPPQNYSSWKRGGGGGGNRGSRGGRYNQNSDQSGLLGAYKGGGGGGGGGPPTSLLGMPPGVQMTSQTNFGYERRKRWR
ncbi:hypothetical protein Avbf_09391 [Armadillidium vulgare]|nr:hypothetical protein Avbf_09391 [Armadillidium vulgare]